MSLDLVFAATLEPGLVPVFILLAIQIVLGGLDNLLHHEMTEALPTRSSARILPPFERVLHTILALNYGALLALLAPVLWAWAQQPAALTLVDRGLWTPVLSVAAVGVGLWGLRDAYAALTLRPIQTDKPRPSGRTVLVTGATGFLGCSLVADLVARGDDVIALTRNPGKARRCLGPDVHCINDLKRIDGDARIHAIVNLAGANVADRLWSTARRRVLIQSRLRTTRAVLDLVKRLRWTPEVLVSASAVGVYGDGGEAELTEATRPPNGVFTAELCKMWEATAGEADLRGVRTVRLRFGLVLGRGGGAFPRLIMTRALGVLTRFGNGRQWMAWIHKADALGLIHHALRTRDLSGPINAVAPVRARHGEVIRAIAGPRRIVMALPAGLLRALLGEISELFLASQKVSASKASASGYRFAFADIHAAVDDLTARTVKEGAPRHA